MSDKPQKPSFDLSKIKTGSFERRLSLTKAGLMAGSRMASRYTSTLFADKETKRLERSKALSREANYLVAELGKLKGSVVKIGQVMALYGEHFLPDEVTQALHTLEDRTQAMEWRVINDCLLEQLGHVVLNELEINPLPIGSASLGQVHRAKVKKTGEELCLKVQYPGVAESIDADLDAVTQLLKLANLVSKGPAFDDWLHEVRVMMHREVDYSLEAATTQAFHDMLVGDERFIVPKVYARYSSGSVLATSYEAGEHVTSEHVAALSQVQRNLLGESFLDLFLKELFVWHQIQTDPNFGNYRVRIESDETRLNKNQPSVRLVLLDFGAVQHYDDAFIRPVCQMISCAYHEDLAGVIEGGIALGFMQREWPHEVLERFGQVCIDVLEPLASADSKLARTIPKSCLNSDGQYCWNESDLPTRVAKNATRSAISRYFKIPPKEFVFLNRKLVGVYTFISVIQAQFNGEKQLQTYLQAFDADA